MNNKLVYMKSAQQRFTEFIRPSRYRNQAKYVAPFKDENIKFAHDFKNLQHMHDLRVWTLVYSPKSANDERRLHEIYHLNNEIWYQFSHAYWKRVLFIPVFFFVVARLFNKSIIQKFNNDSHDTSYAPRPAFD